MSTEARGIELVMPLLQKVVKPGTPIIDTHDARNSVHWQRALGDYLFLHANRDTWESVDVKTEERYTGNLFVESWSNKSAHRSRDGWIFTLGADWLVMVYLDVQAAFVVDLMRLKEWCITQGGMLDYPEKTVHRYESGGQPNRTTGHPVPWARLLEPLGVRCFLYRNDQWTDCLLVDIERERSRA